MQGAGLILTSYVQSLERVMDITANNVANMTTTGFKRHGIAFDTYIIQPARQSEFQFAVENGTYRDIQQGPTVMTGNPLDVSIQGEGYFPVQTSQGIRYTRAGSFMLNGEGELVTPQGYQVLGDGGAAIAVPEDARDITIASDGTVSAAIGPEANMQELGRLRVMGFVADQALMHVGDNLYMANEEPEAVEGSRMVQGGIEQSNVQGVVEMSRMMEVTRTYQTIVHLLELENERQRTAISRLGSTTA